MKKMRARTQRLRTAERRLAVARRLIEKLPIFERFRSFEESLVEDAAELGLTVDGMVALSIKLEDTENIRDDATITISSVKGQLDLLDPPGFSQPTRSG